MTFPILSVGNERSDVTFVPLLICQMGRLLPGFKGWSGLCQKGIISLQCLESFQDVPSRCTELFQIHNETTVKARHTGLRAFIASDLIHANHMYSV